MRLKVYKEKIIKCIFLCREKLSRPSTESCVRAVVAITTLLNGCPELGTSQVGKEGVLQMMLTMANTDDFVQQLAASEALIAATQKKKDSSMIVSQARMPK